MGKGLRGSMAHPPPNFTWQILASGRTNCSEGPSCSLQEAERKAVKHKAKSKSTNSLDSESSFACMRVKIWVKVLLKYRVATFLGSGNPFWSHSHVADSHCKGGEPQLLGLLLVYDIQFWGCPIFTHTHVLTHHCMGLQGSVKRIQFHSCTKGRANPRLKP